MIGTPEYGKNIMDIINLCLRQYLRVNMCMVGIYRAEDVKNK